MPFIINKYGKRVNVDIELDTFNNNCVLYHDNAGFRKIYILNLYKGKTGGNYGEKECDLHKQIEFWDKPPTEDQIMYEMWKEGLSRYDFVTIEEGLMLDWVDDRDEK